MKKLILTSQFQIFDSINITCGYLRTIEFQFDDLHPILAVFGSSLIIFGPQTPFETHGLLENKSHISILTIWHYRYHLRISKDQWEDFRLILTGSSLLWQFLCPLLTIFDFEMPWTTNRLLKIFISISVIIINQH